MRSILNENMKFFVKNEELHRIKFGTLSQNLIRFTVSLRWSHYCSRSAGCTWKTETSRLSTFLQTKSSDCNS